MIITDPVELKNFSAMRENAYWRGRVRADFQDVLHFAEELDSEKVSEKLLKNSPRIKAALVDGVFVKRYNLPGLWNQFRRFFKLGRPEKALIAAEALDRAGLMTPRVLAILQQWQGMRRRDYLLTESLPQEMRPIYSFFTRESGKNWELFADTLLPFLVKMHLAGIEHGDLSLRNIFASPDLQKVALIDLDSCEVISHQLNVQMCEKELARVASSFIIYRREYDPAELAADIAVRYRNLSGTLCLADKIGKRMNKLLKHYS